MGYSYFRHLQCFCRGIGGAGRCNCCFCRIRKAPEFKFPTAHNNSYAAYKWSLANASTFKADSTKVAIAGGNLAVAVAMMARIMVLENRGYFQYILLLIMISIQRYTINIQCKIFE